MFDLERDPGELEPLEDGEKKELLLTEMARLFQENDAPPEAYARYGLRTDFQDKQERRING